MPSLSRRHLLPLLAAAPLAAAPLAAGCGVGRDDEDLISLNGREYRVGGAFEKLCELFGPFCRHTAARGGPPQWIPKYGGSFPGFHLMLHPTEGVWSVGTASPRATRSTASARSSPVTGTLLEGRLPSN